ncbi:hypothetical protein ISF_05188 [Cordyceps fumosorosea ARSEF 2679]|uniref:Uncharacterized protein n=1 Tax=Cordyceps fumosorosea (strain ARSEF 2679) TaxID=1081104 RepID=A0A162MKV8_CORFA|nr:hypothetical protein ISF_05188 [Cordyceps fumosorosea ARSEF 2679]OAA62179.1 hypothetical protein ISF_05188 [Cordyceps fumosorosea ARSEF 2679]
MRRRWVLLLPCLAMLACADGWDDFSNNLASDLAPILALFGEQVTKQFLSESTSWLDNFIFAMVPLGILTAVVSAIRVCGGSSLRAFIGRAQEGGGVAEAELCSSTSRDVCELYHNGSIVRVFGRPKILEIVHDPTDALFYDEDDKTANFGIYSFQEYIGDPPKGSAWTEDGKPVQGSREADDDVEAARDGQKPPSSAKDEIRFALNPNLSLNIGIKKHPRWMRLAAGLGLSLQCWIIAYAALVKYRWRWKKNDRVTPDWALGLMAAGTVAQCSGMYLCAMLVERSTKERVFKRKATGQGDPMLRVVQPGNQVIGDQTFDPFSFATDPKEPLEEYTTSWKDTQKRTTEWKVYCSVVLTLVGFAAQFTGLRYMHSSVSVTQLGAILLMSLARSMLRTERLKKEENRLQDRPDEVEGSELDWLAIQIGGDGDYDPKNSALLWSVVADAERKSSTRDMEGPGHGKAEVASGAKPNVVTESKVMKERNKTTSSVESIEMISNAGNPQNTDAVNVTDKCDKPIDQIHILRSASHSTASDRMIKAGHMNWLKHTDCRKDPKQHICPATLLHYRARLAQLTSQSKPSRAGRSNVRGDQLVRARPPARQLKKAIEATADILFAHGMVKEVYQAAQHFTWSLSSHNRVESRFGNQAANGQPTANTEESDQRIAAGFSHCQDKEAEQSRPPQTHQQSQSETSCEIHLSLIRPVKGKTLSSWQADQHALEAVIGLSAWSMISHPIKETQDNFGLTISEAAGVPNGRILAAAKNAKDLQRAKVDLELWIGDFLVQTTERRLASNLSPYHKGPSVVWQDDEADFKVLAAKSVGPQLRLFGWETTKGVRHDVDLNNTELLTLISTFPVSDSSNNPLPTLCAQDIYQSFLCSITAIMDSVGPKGAAGLGIERIS